MKAKTSIEDGIYTITLYGAEGAEDAVLKALQGMEVTPAKYSEGEIRLEFRPKAAVPIRKVPREPFQIEEKDAS